LKTKNKRKIISQLKNIKPSEKTDYSYVRALMSDLMMGTELMGVTDNEKLELYRWITYHNKPSDVSALGAPPKKCVVNYQRCNKPYSPMFYASDNPVTALSEIQPTLTWGANNKKFYLSKWVAKRGFLLIADICFRSHYFRNNLPKVSKIVIEYLHELFYLQDHTFSIDYIKTAALTEVLLNNILRGGKNIPQRFVGVCYPSTMDKLEDSKRVGSIWYINYAIYPNIIDEHFSCAYVQEWEWKPNIVLPHQVDYQNTDHGIIDLHGNIHWKNRGSHYQELNKFMEFKEWRGLPLLIDKRNGTYIDPF